MRFILQHFTQMSLYNLFFCSNNTQFYICKQECIQCIASASTVAIDAYPVNNYQIFKYAIKLDSDCLVSIKISQITKICPQTFEFDPTQAVNTSVSLQLLRNYDIITNIGHCLLNSMNNNKQHLLNDIDNDKKILNGQISKHLKDIDDLNTQISILLSQIHQYQIDIQVIHVYIFVNLLVLTILRVILFFN